MVKMAGTNQDVDPIIVGAIHEFEAIAESEADKKRAAELLNEAAEVLQAEVELNGILVGVCPGFKDYVGPEFERWKVSAEAHVDRRGLLRNYFADKRVKKMLPPTGAP